MVMTRDGQDKYEGIRKPKSIVLGKRGMLCNRMLNTYRHVGGCSESWSRV